MEHRSAGTARDDAGGERPRALLLVAGGVVAFGALLGVWIALAGQPDTQDLVAGSCTAAMAVGVGFFVSQRGRVLPGILLTDVRMLAALPRQVVAETVQVFIAAARHGARGRGPMGSWSTIPLPQGAGGAHVAGASVAATGWRAARRDSVLTALLSASPNTIVGAIDADTGTALVHRLIPAPSPVLPEDLPDR